MLNRVRSAIQSVTWEDWSVALFGASFFVGIWYAFPMVNNSTDIWPFGGGVLRAIEAHTLLPGYGVAYGTLSFYQNYIAMIIALGIGYIAVGFDAAMLKTLLILNPWYSLVVPRVTSILTAIALLVFVYRFLQQHVASASWRLALLMLTFGNVLAALLTRSGKMWMLSIGLGVVSFIYLYRALTEESGIALRAATISILAAFLATANFAFAAVFLINIPILWYMLPKTSAVFKRLAVATLSGLALFGVIFALNAANIVEQVGGFITQFFSGAGDVARAHAALTPFESFLVNARQAIESFPLLLCALIPALIGGIRDRLLANLAMIYVFVYMLAVSFIFRSDDGLALNVRHIFPIGFFLLFFLVACRPPARWVAHSFLLVGTLIYVYTIFLFSVPSTYNAAYDFIEDRYAGESIRIDENIFELTLPMNKASYLLYATSSCGSTCQHMRTLSSDIAFRPLVVTTDSDPIAIASLPEPDLLVVERPLPDCTEITHFGDTPDVFDIDINLGRMLMPSFYALSQLGKNIYVYDARGCAMNP